MGWSVWEVPGRGAVWAGSTRSQQQRETAAQRGACPAAARAPTRLVGCRAPLQTQQLVMIYWRLQRRRIVRKHIGLRKRSIPAAPTKRQDCSARHTAAGHAAAAAPPTCELPSALREPARLTAACSVASRERYSLRSAADTCKRGGWHAAHACRCSIGRLRGRSCRESSAHQARRRPNSNLCPACQRSAPTPPSCPHPHQPHQGDWPAHPWRLGGRLQHGDGVCVVPQLRQQRGQAGVRLGVVRVERHGAAAVGDGLGRGGGVGGGGAGCRLEVQRQEGGCSARGWRQGSEGPCPRLSCTFRAMHPA